MGPHSKRGSMTVKKARLRFDREAILAMYPHYRAIREMGRVMGMPLAYKRDLRLHDRRELAKRDPSLPFVWVLRVYGTHLVYPDMLATWPDPIKGMLQAFGPDQVFYAWNGRTLFRVDAEGARQFLTDMLASEKESRQAS